MKTALIILLAIALHVKLIAQPAGTIVAFGGTNIPAGWVECNGKILDGTLPAYKNLFDAIGKNWGGGDGKQFAVPDLRGMFLRGWAMSGGANGKDLDSAARLPSNPAYAIPGNTAGVGSKQSDAIIQHRHDYWHGEGSGGGSEIGLGAEVFRNIPDRNRLSTSEINDGAPKALYISDHETRPKNASVIYIIKL